MSKRIEIPKFVEHLDGNDWTSTAEIGNVIEIANSQMVLFHVHETNGTQFWRWSTCAVMPDMTAEAILVNKTIYRLSGNIGQAEDGLTFTQDFRAPNSSIVDCERVDISGFNLPADCFITADGRVFLPFNREIGYPALAQQLGLL